MNRPETEKPAAADTANGLQILDQLGSEIGNQHSLDGRLAQRLQPDLLAEIMACNPLPQSAIDRMIAAGVPVLALARSWAGLHSPIRSAEIVPLGDTVFEFRINMIRNQDGEAVPAFVVPVYDRFGEPFDIAGWTPSFLGTWLGRAALLGQEELQSWRLAEGAVPVYSTPREWLVARRDGVCVIDWKRAGDLLRDRPMIASDVALGKRLRAACTRPAPRILVPSIAGRTAA